jgi:hypothetical protein
METILVTLAAFGGGACLMVAAHRFTQARVRLDLLRRQRQKDRLARRRPA